jgi:hypothetical protein
MGMQLSIAGHISDAAIARALLIQMVSVSFGGRERHQHVQPATGIIRLGIAAAQSEESSGNEHARHMPIDHEDLTVSH